jgi:hypothetical protein
MERQPRKIRTVTKWPAALESPRFAGEKQTFEVIVDQAIKEDEEGEVSSDTLKSAHNLVNGLRAKLAAEPLEDVKASSIPCSTFSVSYSASEE